MYLSAVAEQLEFLMYRVELKVLRRDGVCWQGERFLMYRVELKVFLYLITQEPYSLFLMYRVELKESLSNTISSAILLVPNVPCGVESPPTHPTRRWHDLFLMYRVELKAGYTNHRNYNCEKFLMYRVELKGYLVMGKA